MSQRVVLQVNGRPYTLDVRREGDRVTLAGTHDDRDLPAVTADLMVDGPWIIVRLDGVVHRCLVAGDNHGIWVSLHGRSFHLEAARVSAAGGAGGATQETDEIRAPMTGTVISVNVDVGAIVTRGDLVAVMEAMKMEYRLEAQVDGKVARVEAQAGDMLDVGALIVKLETAAPE